MTCKDCLHYKACKMTYLTTCGHGDDTFEEFNWVTIYGCDNFADKSEWVRLPCKMGNIAYLIKETKFHNRYIVRIVIGKIVLYRSNGSDKDLACLIASDDEAVSGILGTSAFLTKQEAEKALAERRKENGEVH